MYFNQSFEPHVSLRNMHALDIFAAGAMYLYLFSERAFKHVDTSVQKLTVISKAALTAVRTALLEAVMIFTTEQPPWVSDDTARIMEMMHYNPQAPFRMPPTACELLQKPPFSHHPRCEGKSKGIFNKSTKFCCCTDATHSKCRCRHSQCASDAGKSRDYKVHLALGVS